MIVTEKENANVVVLSPEIGIVKGKEKEENGEKGKEAIDWSILKLMMVEKSKLKKNHWMVILLLLNFICFLKCVCTFAASSKLFKYDIFLRDAGC